MATSSTWMRAPVLMELHVTLMLVKNSTRKDTVVETNVSPFGLHQPKGRNVRLNHCLFPCTNYSSIKIDLGEKHYFEKKKTQKGGKKKITDMQFSAQLTDKIANRSGAPRPSLTDVGTETAFRLDQRKHFRKSKHLLRSEVSWCDLCLRGHCTSE